MPALRNATFPALRTASLAALLAAAATPALAAPGPADVLRVQRAEIIDHKGFEKPMLAGTLMVPAGWKHQGEVRWRSNGSYVLTDDPDFDPGRSLGMRGKRMEPTREK